MTDSIYINGLPLPEALVRAVESGVWQTPKTREAWLSLFPSKEIVAPLLYPLAKMQGHDCWLGLRHPAYLGEKAEGVWPGDIDQSRAVLIADLGADRLIALDYRESQSRPSVIALTSHRRSSWRHVADDIESFMKAIGLIVSVREDCQFA